MRDTLHSRRSIICPRSLDAERRVKLERRSGIEKTLRDFVDVFVLLLSDQSEKKI